METKHTTGPWVIDWNVSRLDIFGADETTLVASLRRSPLSQAIDEAARSNARLIAAAPELLEFVLAFRDANYEEDGWIDLKSFAKTASALIAKAEGK